MKDEMKFREVSQLVDGRKLFRSLYGKRGVIPENKILYFLEGLSPRENFVIRKRFAKTLTLEEIGSLIPNLRRRNSGISRERVRQIEAQALRRLRRKQCLTG